jgi:hypothetical protein
MWAGFLGGQRDLFSTERLIELGELLTVDVQHGINDALWGPTPDSDNEDDEALVAPGVSSSDDMDWLWAEDEDPDAR